MAEKIHFAAPIREGAKPRQASQAHYGGSGLGAPARGLRVTPRDLPAGLE